MQYYRFAKTEIWNTEREKDKSDIARQRFEFREERLKREAEEKAEKSRLRKEALKKKTESNPNKQAAIHAALERAKAKKAQQTAEGLGDNKTLEKSE